MFANNFTSCLFSASGHDDPNSTSPASQCEIVMNRIRGRFPGNDSYQFLGKPRKTRNSLGILFNTEKPGILREQNNTMARMNKRTNFTICRYIQKWNPLSLLHCIVEFYNM